jgi:hypothetical protein
MRSISVSLLFASLAIAQSSDTILFRAIMLPTNEVPAAQIDARATADVRARVVRDASGQVISGSVDFRISHNFPANQTFTGLHIHRGIAGINGPVVIDSGITGAASLASETGIGVITRQAQIRTTDTAALLALREMVEDPASFYVNLHTTQFPGGAVRGQVDATLVSQFVTRLSPANEIPPISSNASGVCSITVVRGFDGQGRFNSGSVLFEVDYNFLEQVTLTGFHIHQGGADINGPVVVNTGISAAAPVVTAEDGRGNATYLIEFGGTVANEILLGELSRFPNMFYVNMHTTTFPGGLIRGQLSEAVTRRFDITMLPTNEVPVISDLNATAIANVRMVAARGSDGNINAAMVTFDVNHRFPGAVEFTGLHIHEGDAGVNGPVRLDSGINARASVSSATGNGNINRSFRAPEGAGLDAVRAIYNTPERYYLNLHTTVNPGGAVRAQLQ